MNFPGPNGCWPTVAMMPTGIVTLYRRRGSLPAFRVANPATRPSNTTNAATNGATGSRSCSGVSKTGGVSRRAMTGAQWPSSPQSLSLLPLSSGSDQRVLSLAFASAILTGVVSHSLGLPFDPVGAFRFFSGFAAGLVAAKITKDTDHG